MRLDSLYVVFIIAIVLISLATLAVYRVSTWEYINKSAVPRNGAAFLAGYDLTIHRHNGKTITIHKADDPITKQFIYAAIDNFLLIHTGYEKAWLDTLGTPRTLIDTADEPSAPNYFYYPSMYLVLGNGTTPASTNDYQIYSPVIEDKVSYISLNDTGNEYIITYFLDIVSDKNFTLSEIGLESKVYLFKSATVVSLLISRDSLSPISIYVNDTISIRYRIILRYDVNGGLTQNFFSAVMVYLLGVSRSDVTLYTYQGQTTDPIGGAPVEIDLGYDTGSTATESVADNVLFTIASITLNTPTFKTYLVNSYKPQLGLLVSISDTSTNVTVSIKYTVTTTTSFTFNSLAILLGCDGAANRDGFPTKYLMFVAPVQESSLGADQYVEASISITFELGG